MFMMRAWEPAQIGITHWGTFGHYWQFTDSIMLSYFLSCVELTVNQIPSAPDRTHALTSSNIYWNASPDVTAANAGINANN